MMGGSACVITVRAEDLSSGNVGRVLGGLYHTRCCLAHIIAPPVTSFRENVERPCADVGDDTMLKGV